MTERGLFITFEGGEGAGKSTQIRRLADAMQASGREVVATREPGGTPGAEALRHALLSGAARSLGPLAEACLFASARADHVRHFIGPALAQGKDVVCDRFIDSTRAYQGSAGVAEEMLERLEAIALGGIRPDLTILLDLAPEVGLERARSRRQEAEADRFEADLLARHTERRLAFLRIAERELDRVVVVDADGPPEAVARTVAGIVEERFGLALPSVDGDVPTDEANA